MRSEKISMLSPDEELTHLKLMVNKFFLVDILCCNSFTLEPDLFSS